MTQVLFWLFLASGLWLITVAAVGVVRLPDAYSRLNAVTKAVSLGVASLLAAAWLADPGWATAVKALLSVWLLLTTAPVGGYAIARALYRSGASLGDRARYDELRDDPP